MRGLGAVPLGGGLRGTLPYPDVVADDWGLVLAGRIFGPRADAPLEPAAGANVTLTRSLGRVSIAATAPGAASDDADALVAREAFARREAVERRLVAGAGITIIESLGERIIAAAGGSSPDADTSVLALRVFGLRDEPTTIEAGTGLSLARALGRVVLSLVAEDLQAILAGRIFATPAARADALEAGAGISLTRRLGQVTVAATGVLTPDDAPTMLGAALFARTAAAAVRLVAGSGITITQRLGEVTIEASGGSGMTHPQVLARTLGA
ncbi:MAG: hypothetical protein IT561_28365 [Alphaproteobacteria bacterium]|nr:hypothetical protein [Alphaproteobacteria bacterium]